MCSDYTLLPSLILVWISYNNTWCRKYWHYITDFIFNIIIARFILLSYYCGALCFQPLLCVCVSVYVCGVSVFSVCIYIYICMNVLGNLVRLVTAWGSLLCEGMPVLHFLPFVFETVEPVSESLTACINAQLHSTWNKRDRCSHQLCFERKTAVKARSGLLVLDVLSEV